ncbi:hypothetical protein [Fischerella sp. PCC 9605]|uniref:hypothetical protein n=1 Tax=Fischerella sp. PCC 9605 TaxID=1173024 RepID=UPI0007C4407C|nr:hypothetical protein [Fischerella sp. PCC 9605]
MNSLQQKAIASPEKTSCDRPLTLIKGISIMTHRIYTQQALRELKLSQLKKIAASLGVKPTGDKRETQTWVKAIIEHQSSQFLHIDSQAQAQAELENYIEAQAQAIAPEELTSVEISFYNHEIYAGQKLIAKITYDGDDFQTQRWVVKVNEAEVHRANTFAKCHSYITWHYTQGELPVQEAEVPATTTGNEVMVKIAAECEKFGFDLLEDGIFHDDVKLGEVGCTDGRWWFVLASSQHQERVPCDSVTDAVWSLSMVSAKQFNQHPAPSNQEEIEEAATPSKYADTNLVCCEQLLDRPFDQLTPTEWNRLLEYSPTDETEELVAA